MELRDIFDPFHNTLPIKLGRNEARALYEWTEGHARKIGLEHVPIDIYRVPHDFSNAGASFEEGRGVIAVTDGFIKNVLGAPDLNVHVPEGLKGLLGHEMSHVRDIYKGIDGERLRKIPIFALPLLSVVGYELYTRAHSRLAEDPSKKLDQLLDEVVEEKKKKSNASDSSMLDRAKKVALIGAGGLLAGGMVARHMSLASEFRADRAAILATGVKPEVVIETMQKMSKSTEEMITPKLNEWASNIAKRSFMQNVREIYQVVMHDLSATFLHAHPKDIVRYQAMRNIPTPSLAH